MKPENASPPDANEEIAALIETLHQSEQRLEELTAGEVDTVSNRAGRTLMLQRAQVELRLGEATKQAAILNALPAHIALLDSQGRIISVNETWRRFASTNALLSPEYGAGLNYLEVCDNAWGNNATEATQAAAGIRSVLAGTAKNFSLEYPCHSPAEQRWFQMTVSPLADEHPNGAVVMHMNITERKLVEESLRASEAEFHTLSEAMPQIVWITRADGWNIYFNQQWMDYTGLTLEESLGHGWNKTFHPDEQQRAWDTWEHATKTQGIYSIESRLRRADGVYRWWLVRGVPLTDANGNILKWFGTCTDIHDMKMLAQLLETEHSRLVAAQRIAKIGSWETDLATLAVIWSDQTHRIFETDPGKFKPTHQAFLELVHPDDRATVDCAFSKSLEQSSPQNIEHRILMPDGRIKFVEEHWQAYFDDQKRPVQAVGTIQDITERMQGEQRLLQLAHYDSLTNLPNRVLFKDRLHQAIAQAERNNWITAVMFIDLDGFKMVNDTLGHAEGDRLLQVVSERLSGCLRSADTIARLGGDEFAIILTNLRQAEDAGPVALKLMAVIAEPAKLDDNEAFVTGSIGITLCPTDGTSPDDLIRNADTAMYQAKEMGRNNCQFFVPDMNARMQEKATLSNSLRRALEHNELFLHYQPQLDLTSGQIIGAEALVRWRHPIHGVVPPGKFIPIAEETGLIVQIGEWVLRTACAQNKAWQDAGLSAVEMSVNLSARQFGQSDMVTLVKKVLEDTGLDGRYLELELTESMMMDRAEEFIKILNQLRMLHVRLSIDDFGTGYSNLSYLERFPLHTLKIDRSFVKDIGFGGNGTIAKAVIQLAHSLGFKVIAEGVETDVQMAFLRNHGCDAIQGFYFSRPIPADDFAALLEQHKLVPAT